MFCYALATKSAVQTPRIGWVVICKNVFCFTILVLAVVLPKAARAQECNDANSSRPVLFVHGFLEGSDAWSKVRTAEISDLSSTPGYSNAQNYDLYFDGANVRLSEGDTTTDPLANSADIPCDARFFSIKFYAWVPGPLAFDSLQVANISIITKAFELSEVIKAITGLTFAKDVIVVGHSMGALDVRAYVEGLGSAYDGPCNAYPCYEAGTLKYKGDVAHIVTLDGANGGSDLASLFQYLLGANIPYLGTAHVLNLEELEPDNPADPLVPTLNYESSYNGIEALAIPPGLGIDAIISQYSDGETVSCTLSDSACSWDNVVTSDSQSIEMPLKSQAFADLTDYPNSYSTYDPTIGLNPDCYTNGYLALHLLPCLGDSHLSGQKSASQILYDRISSYTQSQLTQVFITVDYNGKPYAGANLRLTGPNGVAQITSSEQPAVLLGPQVPPSPQVPAVPNADAVPYELSYVSGGPSGTGSPIIVGTDASGQPCSPCYIQPGNWAITYNVNFTATAPFVPSVTTGPTGIAQGDGATFGATVNPNGTTTSVWFEWGTNSSLSSFSSTTAQTLGAGTADQTISVTIGGLESNTTYYYRAAASNGATTVRGSILSFTTLGTLPKPTLQTPTDGATGVSTAPSFSWMAIANASSYRLIVATTPSALPTDPTVATCGSGCVLNATPAGTAYSPASGVLNSGTTYYWEVHARSATQYGDWSAVSSFTVGASAVSDFSFQLTPSSQSVSQSNTVAFGIATATTGGQSQTLALSVGNLPVGATAIFTPPLLNSGDSGVFGITTSSSTPVGTYTLTVVASGSSSSHSSQVSLTVTGASSGMPNFGAAPASWTFGDQTVGTISSAQSFTVQNTGSGQLTINNISLASGGDFVFFGIPGFPQNIAAGGQFQFQVAFDPATAGQRPDHILIWDNAAGSPQIIPISGNGLAAPPTNGTIQVLGTLNGTPLPNTNTFSYAFSYGISGPTSISGGGAETFTAAPGAYTASFSGSPGYFTLASITPSGTQTVTAGSTTTFTLNFTAPDDFLPPSFLYPANAERALIVKAGSTANYTASPDAVSGSASTPVTLQVAGTPLGATATFSPQPVYSGLDSTLAVTTDATATPIGAYTLTLTGTNSSGLTHPGDTSSLLVTGAPASPVALASVSTSGSQANAGSAYETDGAISGNGRFAVFQSTATNLVAGALTGNGQTHIYLRDFQSGATTLVDLANDGTPANNGASNPTISSNSQYVAFTSQATNLPQPPGNGNTGLFIRDVQAGRTERVDINSGGTIANGTFSGDPSINADGRFVAFVSDATNLVPGITPTDSQVYVRDLDTGTVTLVSAASDGSPANQGATLPSISADGRYVAFLSASTNLVQLNTNGLEQVYVRDLQAGQTVLASIGSDGSPANSAVLANENAPALSADGRFVAFTSNAANLVPGAIDANGDFRVFLRDLDSQQTKLIDTDAAGIPLSQGGHGADDQRRRSFRCIHDLRPNDRSRPDRQPQCRSQRGG